MIDHIGTNRISIRQGEHGVVITLLSGAPPLKLSAEEWFDLCGLVTAITRAVDFAEAYEPDEARK